MVKKKTSAASTAASALSAARWAKTTAGERSKIMEAMAKTRWKGFTAEQRTAAARKAALARWGNKKGRPTGDKP